MQENLQVGNEKKDGFLPIGQKNINQLSRGAKSITFTRCAFDDIIFRTQVSLYECTWKKMTVEGKEGKVILSYDLMTHTVHNIHLLDNGSMELMVEEDTICFYEMTLPPITTLVMDDVKTIRFYKSFFHGNIIFSANWKGEGLIELDSESQFKGKVFNGKLTLLSQLSKRK
jgi:hypothetical protein